MPIASHLTLHAMQNTPAYHNECLINRNRCICKLKRKGWEGDGSLTWNSCFSGKEENWVFRQKQRPLAVNKTITDCDWHVVILVNSIFYFWFNLFWNYKQLLLKCLRFVSYSVFESAVNLHVDHREILFVEYFFLFYANQRKIKYKKRKKSLRTFCKLYIFQWNHRLWFLKK